jgi:hypothetical protein
MTCEFRVNVLVLQAFGMFPVFLMQKNAKHRRHLLFSVSTFHDEAVTERAQSSRRHNTEYNARD